MPVEGYDVDVVNLDYLKEAMDPALVNTCCFYLRIEVVLPGKEAD